jgi:hypothetical protein
LELPGRVADSCRLLRLLHCNTAADARQGQCATFLNESLVFSDTFCHTLFMFTIYVSRLISMRSAKDALW